jgi:hypothetical protein
MSYYAAQLLISWLLVAVSLRRVWRWLRTGR